jgi:hypothetical protein
MDSADVNAVDSIESPELGPSQHITRLVEDKLKQLEVEKSVASHDTKRAGY